MIASRCCNHLRFTHLGFFQHARNFTLTPFPNVSASFLAKSSADQNGPAGPKAKAKAIVNAVLHGSEKAKHTMEEDDQTYSKILSRGKYVHELQSKSVEKGCEPLLLPKGHVEMNMLVMNFH